MISSANVVSASLRPPVQSAPSATILFLATPGAMHQGLVQAMQVHLPHHIVHLLDQLPGEEFEVADVRLVLLDLGSSPAYRGLVVACRERFPDAALGLVMRDSDWDAADCTLLFDRGEVQGLLPLDLTLEVWLAALSLLVQGGEYLPPALSRRVHRIEPDEPDFSSHQNVDYRPPASGGPAVHLTKRECQVLELLSEGYQNKLIANQMALSEHTVKVHVHNLITKMRVSNRTQAAAAFRSGRYAAVRERSMVGPVVYSSRR